jgi:Holliday junction resolvasome RuvABC endonuclease subunit
MRVLSLDLATRTGWAAWNGIRRESGYVDFDLKRGESPGTRFIRFNRWLLDILVTVDPELVVYEKAFGLMKSGAAAEIALGLATRVMEACDKREPPIPYLPIHGSTLKKWTVGHGRASKSEMVAAVARRFSGELNADEDETDAIALLCYAMEELCPTRD